MSVINTDSNSLFSSAIGIQIKTSIHCRSYKKFGFIGFWTFYASFYGTPNNTELARSEIEVYDIKQIIKGIKHGVLGIITIIFVFLCHLVFKNKITKL